MHKSILSAACALGLAVFAPLAVSAATIISTPSGIGVSPASPTPVDISVGDDILMFGSLDPNAAPIETEVTFTFTALEDLSVTGMSLTTNGNLLDIQDFEISSLPPIANADTEFTTITGSGDNATGSAFFGEFNMSATDQITVTVFLSSFSNVSVLNGLTLRFQAVDAAIPVPAALPMALTALGGLALVGRRRA